MSYTPCMEGTERMSVEQMRKDLGGRIDAAWFKDEMTVLTKYGQDRAVIVPPKFVAELEQLRAEVKDLRAQVKRAAK